LDKAIAVLIVKFSWLCCHDSGTEKSNAVWFCILLEFFTVPLLVFVVCHYLLPFTWFLLSHMSGIVLWPIMMCSADRLKHCHMIFIVTGCSDNRPRLLFVILQMMNVIHLSKINYNIHHFQNGEW